jgi:hypothetical protein
MLNINCPVYFSGYIMEGSVTRTLGFLKIVANLLRPAFLEAGSESIWMIPSLRVWPFACRLVTYTTFSVHYSYARRVART